MKRCPYCAEEIQDEAIYCRYCKHFLNQTEDIVNREINSTKPTAPINVVGTSLVSSREFVDNSQLTRKQKAMSWFLLLVIYCIIYGFSLYNHLLENFLDMEVANIVVWIGFFTATLFFIGWLKNISNMHVAWRIILSLISAFILNTVIGFGIGLFLGTQADFWQGLIEDVQSQSSPAPALISTLVPTESQAIRISKAATATAVSSYNQTAVYAPKFPTSTNQNSGDCQRWSDVTLGQLNTSTCVYGEAIDTFLRDDVFYIVFSNNPDDFYFLSYGDTWYEGMKGNCVMAEGKIKQLGGTPVMVVEENNYFHCE